MGKLNHYFSNLSEYDPSDDEEIVNQLITTLNSVCVEPECDKSTYGEDVPLDDEFLINVDCVFITLNTELMKSSEDAVDQELDNDVLGDRPICKWEIKKEIVKTFKRPIQGFPTNYEEAWHVTYTWLEKELHMLDSYVLPTITHEMVYWALYVISEIPKGRKKFQISIRGTIEERLLELPVLSPVDLSTTSTFISEIAKWETVEPYARHNKTPNTLKHDTDSEEGDEELVINLYSEYRPIGVDNSICKYYKLSHPSDELWGLKDVYVRDIVSMMLEQVDLPGIEQHACLLNEINASVCELFVSYFPKLSLELNVVIRITEILRRPPTPEEDAFFPRLSTDPRLLVTPLRSSHLNQNSDIF